MRLPKAAVLTALPTILLAVGAVTPVEHSDTHRSSSEVRHQHFIDPPWDKLDPLVGVIRWPSPHPQPPADRVDATASPRQDTYTVRPGDSLWAIAAATGTNMDNLAVDNHLQLWDTIYPGETLTLPDPNQPPPATPLPLWPPTPAQPNPTAPQTVTAAYWSPTGIWACIAQHESGGNPAENTGNGYYGAFQFSLSSWQAAGGGPGLPSDYSYAYQLAVAERLQQMQGWSAWPQTSRMCGV